MANSGKKSNKTNAIRHECHDEKRDERSPKKGRHAPYNRTKFKNYKEEEE